MRWRFVAPLLALAFAPAEAAEDLVGRVTVIDGDTFDLRGQRIRLFGVDAPEAGQICQDRNGASYRCGQRAALALSNRLGTASVSCTPVDRDIYGRIVANCRQNGADIGAWLVANGYAVAYREFGTDYVTQELSARTQNRGIWDGTFTLPSEFRGAQRLPGVVIAPNPSGCTIKGNVNALGECIYHLPGSRSYADTVITPARGENYYCSVAEAERAGCRAAP